jgi:cullin-associated NEDD8-dissociated protein 1
LETRKAAFECIYTLLEKLSDVVSVAQLVQPLLSGLEDENEIKLQSYLIIVRLTAVASSSLLEVLDSLLEGIKKELKKKIDKTAIAQAQERQLELKRAALRSVVALGTVAGAESNAKFKEVVESVITSAGLKEQYDLILRQEQEQDQ